MKDCVLPTHSKCLQIIRDCRVPRHIIKHSEAVAKLAVFLAEKLKEKGIEVNVDLVHRASLLHDVLRVCDMKESDYSRFEQNVTEKDRAHWRHLKVKYNNNCHEDATYELLRKDYPELALTIKKHRYLAILDEKEKPSTWEEKIVYYADKRVMHETVVLLKERLEEAHERHARQHERTARDEINITKTDRQIYELEKEIFYEIDLNPAEITQELIDSNSEEKTIIFEDTT
jgi:uncharacterized protein